MPEVTPTANPTQPKQPPFGTPAAAQPTPNRGFEAAGMQQLGPLVQALIEIVPKVGAGSDAGQAILKAVQSLSKFVPPGSVTPASQQQMVRALQQRMAQNNPQMAALAQMRQQGQQPGAMQTGKAA